MHVLCMSSRTVCRAMYSTVGLVWLQSGGKKSRTMQPRLRCNECLTATLIQNSYLAIAWLCNQATEFTNIHPNLECSGDKEATKGLPSR